LFGDRVASYIHGSIPWAEVVCAEEIMNYEVRIMKESGKTCSAKRTHGLRKGKAGREL